MISLSIEKTMILLEHTRRVRIHFKHFSTHQVAKSFKWLWNCRIKNASVWPFRAIKSSFATAGFKVTWIFRSIYRALNRTDVFEVSVCARHRIVCFERTDNTGINLDSVILLWYLVFSSIFGCDHGREAEELFKRNGIP